MATPSGDDAALREAIGGWQRTRHPRFATIAGLATARALRASPRPVIGEGGTAKARAAWDALCAAGDPLDLPRLFATFAGARSTEAIERLARLAARNQPGERPWQPDGVITFWCAAFVEDLTHVATELAQLPRGLVARVRLAPHQLDDTSKPLGPPPEPTSVDRLRTDFPALEFVVDWS